MSETMKEKKKKKDLMIIVPIRLEPELHETVKEFAEKEESTVSQIIRKAVKEFFSKRDIRWKNRII